MSMRKIVIDKAPTTESAARRTRRETYAPRLERMTYRGTKDGTHLLRTVLKQSKRTEVGAGNLN